MKLNEFNYELPEELIAQTPLKNRDHARLLVVNRHSQEFTHDYFYNIGKYLPAHSKLVLNDSKVVPARLLTHRQTGGEVEIFLLKKLEDGYSYQTLLRPLRRLQNGEKIHFKDGVYAEIIDWQTRTVRFNRKNLSGFLKKHGHMPLPPYIKRTDQKCDHTDYQTIYAKKEGSVASPTAGLHFTKKLLDQLRKDGHKLHKVTLHVNYGTFKPVESVDITDHKMHAEDYAMSPKSWKILESAKKKGQKIVAIGTTSNRVLETIAQNSKMKGSTDIFIYPGYTFKMVDILITNFHLPFSTLLMLVYAFGGTDLMRRAYQEAIKAKYRFYSYGDAVVIL